MIFSKIFGTSLAEPRYIRRARAYLQEARMAVLEHSIAAEFYQSSADMYAERAARLEEELRVWEEGVQHAHASRSARRSPAKPAKHAGAEVAAVPTQSPTPSVVRAV